VRAARTSSSIPFSSLLPFLTAEYRKEKKKDTRKDNGDPARHQPATTLNN